MPRRERRRAGGPARPIRTRRDYEGAAAVVKKISGQTERNSAAESRLQSLLQEMDKFDEPEDDADPDVADGYGYSGPRRRWSDE